MTSTSSWDRHQTWSCVSTLRYARHSRASVHYTEARQTYVPPYCCRWLVSPTCRHVVTGGWLTLRAAMLFQVVGQPYVPPCCYRWLVRPTYCHVVAGGWSALHAAILDAGFSIESLRLQEREHDEGRHRPHAAV